MKLEMTVEELIQDTRAGKPRVVILGAGASLAAFPDGDKNGKKLPLMCDFVEDRTERGGKLRILVIIDEYTRECLAIRIAPSIPASVVVGVLEWLFLTRGVPKYIRSDNGPEFVAKAVCQWLGSCGCQTLFINPGSPWENGYIESFIDKLRDECLNREIFRKGKQAQAIVENWRQEYNNYRPHSSLDYQTPAEFARRYYEKNQVEARPAEETAGTLSL